MLPARLPPQRAVDPVLQPRGDPRQRAGEEPPGGAGTGGGVRGQGVEPGELFLVAWVESLLLLLPVVPVGVRAHSYGVLLLRAGGHALFPGCVFRVGRGEGGRRDGGVGGEGDRAWGLLRGRWWPTQPESRSGFNSSLNHVGRWI